MQTINEQIKLIYNNGAFFIKPAISLWGRHIGSSMEDIINQIEEIIDHIQNKINDEVQAGLVQYKLQPQI